MIRGAFDCSAANENGGLPFLNPLSAINSLGRLNPFEMQAPLTRIEMPLANVTARLKRLDLQLTDLKDVIEMILTSIYVAVGVIALGPPIAAIFVFSHRRKIIAGHEPARLAESESNRFAGR